MAVQDGRCRIVRAVYKGGALSRGYSLELFPAAAIYVAIASILAALAWLVTGFGVFALFVAGIWRGAVGFARTMAFPGHVSTVARQIENDVARQHARAEQACLEAVYTLLPERTPVGGLPEAARNARRAIDASWRTRAHAGAARGPWNAPPRRIAISASTEALIDTAEQVLALSTSEGRKTPSRARRVLGERTCRPGPGKLLGDINGGRQQQAVHADCGRRRSGGDCPSISLGGGSGFVDLADLQDQQTAKSPLDTVLNVDFFRMDLVRRHGSGDFAGSGSDGTTFEAIFIPPTVASTGKGVLFCNPNGGMYEYASHWAGYYQSRGLAVLLFNYRGYGRSEGTPEPSVLKRDGIVAFYALQSRLLADRQTVLSWSRESLGGMVAAHVAECAGDVDLLVVDRSFKSLGAAGRYLLAWWAERAWINVVEDRRRARLSALRVQS